MNQFRQLDALRAEMMSGFRPAAVLPLSDFIEQTMWLEQGQSATPGPIELMPFQRELADSLTDPGCEKVTVLKGTRLGFTTLLNGAVLHYIRQRPTSLIFAVPRDEDVKTAVVALETTVTASPKLKGILPMPHAGRHGDRDTMRFRHGPGWSLRFLSTRSATNLRSVAAEVIVCDEVSAYEPTSDGAAIPLLEKRSLTFPRGRRKIIIGSSPGTLPDCYVSASWEQGDQRIWECRCPSCHAYHEITWDAIRWPENRPVEAGWCCPSCGVIHPDSDKPEMVANGRWRALRPEVENHRSYRISCLVAPFQATAWPVLAAEFLIAKRTPETLRVFTSNILGQPWQSDSDDAVQPHELMSLAEPMGLDAIPKEVLWLTSGVDCQGDRLEAVTLGFTATDDWLVLSHDVLIGDPLQDAVWADLRDFLAEKYPHPLGRQIGRDMTAIDAGDGRMMDRVLAFCAGNRDLRLVPIKGAQGLGRPPLTPTASKRARALQICGVDGIKTRIADRLSRRQAIRFSDRLTENFYLQMTSERLVVKYSRGRPERRFERIPGRLAEALDATAYAIAAKAAINVDSVRRSEELKGHPVAPVMPTTIPSAWLQATSQPRY
ncbi:MAG TPA: terminase gpA endonuclease subunit [Stellaceae bacterium]|nr:terminase gpA endonuclease subunit [Stellaceae bacterium]